MIAIIAALLVIGGGIGVFLLTQGSDDDEASDPIETTSISTSPTSSEPTLSVPTPSLPTVEPPTTEPTSSPPDVSSDYPTFSGEEPNKQEYLSLATSLVELAKAEDCEGARSLLVSTLSQRTSDDQLCSGDIVDELNKADLTDYKFDNYHSAGAYIKFENNGVTVSVGMRFLNNELYVDNLFVY